MPLDMNAKECEFEEKYVEDYPKTYMTHLFNNCWAKKALNSYIVNKYSLQLKVCDVKNKLLDEQIS